MRINIKLLIFIIILIGIISGCEKQQVIVKVLDIPDSSPIHVKYNLSSNGLVTMDIFKKGNNVKIVNEMDLGDKKSVVDIYVNNGMLYFVYPMSESKEGAKAKLTEVESFKDVTTLLEIKDSLKKMEKIGSEEILGFSCDNYKSQNNDIFSVYKERIPLKIVSREKVIQALLLEAAADVTDETVTPPKDIKFKELNNPSIRKK